MKKIVKLLLVGILIMGLLISVGGCGGQDKEPANPSEKQTQEKAAADKVEPKPVLLVGSETTYPPFEMTSENGEYVGFDMDLIKAIAAAEGYDVKISTLGFDALIPALQADKVDCVISAMSIRPDRLEKVDFSDPYFNAGLIIAVQKNTEGINSLEDLKGKKLAAEVATTGLAASQEIKAKDAKTQIKVFDAVGEAFMELEKGGVDAVINDEPVTRNYIETTGKDKVKMVGEVFSATDKYGIAIQKGDTKTMEIINSGLKKVKESGEYDKIFKKWFEK